MKKLFISTSFLLGLLFMPACTEDVQLEQNGEMGRMITLHVGMPDTQRDSRVTYNDPGLNLTWETGDELRIKWYDAEGNWLNDETFALENGEGTANGSFQVKVKEGAESANVDYQHGFGNASADEQSCLTNTQHGNNSTAHLKYQLQLTAGNISVDKLAEGNVQLIMQNAIMKFEFQHLPEGMNTPASMHWQNNQDARSSRSLSFDGVNGPFTAYIAFSGMDLNPNGEFAVELTDAGKTYRTGIISKGGKHYEAGKRYTAHIDNSFVWKEKKEQNRKILVRMTEGKTLTLPKFPKYKVSAAPNTQGYFEVSTADNAELHQIPASFFEGNADVIEVKLPSTVSDIGASAFSGTSITSIEIPEGVEKIQEWSFFSCKSLTDVKLPSTVTTIGNSAFNQCQKLKSINLPEGLKSIEWGAFRTCLALDSITLPDGISSMADQIFAWCEALKSIKWPSGTTSVGEGVFQGCKELKTITLPNTVDQIGSNAFNSCTQLTSINIPEGITTLPTYVFTSCTALVNLDLPSTLVSIGDNAFSNCSALASLSLPEGLQSIGTEAFNSCKALQSLHFPSTLTTIGDRMLKECSSLNNITGQFTLDNRYLIKDNKLYGAAIKGMTNIKLPENVVEIGPYVFYNAKETQTVEFNNNLAIIGQYAFGYCDHIQQLHIPASVNHIGDGAFFDCNGLTKVTVLSPSMTLGEYVFIYVGNKELNLYQNLKSQLSGKQWGENSWNPVHIIDNSENILETIE